MKRGEIGAESRRIRPGPGAAGGKGKSMKNRLAAVVLIALAQLAGCGGGGGGSSPQPVTNHTGPPAWAPNPEKGVKSAGGGYQGAISRQPTINPPYVSRLTAPA